MHAWCSRKMRKRWILQWINPFWLFTWYFRCWLGWVLLIRYYVKLRIGFAQLDYYWKAYNASMKADIVQIIQIIRLFQNLLCCMTRYDGQFFIYVLEIRGISIFDSLFKIIFNWMFTISDAVWFRVALTSVWMCITLVQIAVRIWVVIGDKNHRITTILVIN